MKWVIYSGGLDSTEVLLQLAEKFCKPDDHSDREKIAALSFTHNILGETKIKRERQARKKIINKINKYYGTNIINYEFKINLPDNIPVSDYSGIQAQTILWINSIIPFINNGDKVYLGFLQTDQAAPFIEDFKEVFYKLCEINNKKDIILEFPLRYYTKLNLIDILIDNKNEWYIINSTCCENYKDKDNCCKCIPCNTLISSLINRKFYYDNILKNKEKSEVIDYILKKKFNMKVNIEV